MAVTRSQMKEIEMRADACGLSYLEMMENAGKAAFDALIAERPLIKTAAVFCGNGNNGGDGFVLARMLKQNGVSVLIIMAVGEPKTHDAAKNMNLASVLGIPFVKGPALSAEDIGFISSTGAVVDAIYGTGFHGRLPLEAEKCCAVINTSKGLKMSLDLPSGLECDTGSAADGTVLADMTVVFHALKPCHIISPHICGKIVLADIGIDKALNSRYF
ncbi:MAG: NAD(P)H-hydrate epimerase [Clostridiaceae bacterium]|nr:NAD(P)H-hydrate epimerase [Clostridiaceae bacterium]